MSNRGEFVCPRAGLACGETSSCLNCNGCADRDRSNSIRALPAMFLSGGLKKLVSFFVFFFGPRL